MNYIEFIDSQEFAKSKYTIKYLDDLWEEFGDVAIDNNDCILEPFRDWESGTNRFEIWQWFDKNYPFGLAAKMGLSTGKDVPPIMLVAHLFMKELEEFVSSPERNRHIDIEFLQSYVRKSTRPAAVVHDQMIMIQGLDLATLSLPEAYQKKGIMKGILRIMENVARTHGYLFVYVENILVPEVSASFSRRQDWVGLQGNSFIKYLACPKLSTQVFDLSMYLPVLDASTGEWQRKEVAIVRNAVSRKELDSMFEEYTKTVHIQKRQNGCMEDALAETIITTHEVH